MERNKTEDIAYFIAFCVETYKNAHNISGAEASTVFSDHGVMNYLSENFEVRNRPKKAGLIFIFGPENILLFRKVVWQKAF